MKDVGKDVAEEDAAGADTGRAGGVDVIAIAVLDHFSANQAADADPVGQAECEDDQQKRIGLGPDEVEAKMLEGEPGEEHAFEGVDHGDHEENPGDGADGGEEPGDDVVDPTAEVAGEDAQKYSDAQTQDRSEDGDQQGDARTVEQTPDDRPALDVGAQQQIEMLQPRSLIAVGDDFIDAVGEEFGNERGEADEQIEGDDAHAN